MSKIIDPITGLPKGLEGLPQDILAIGEVRHIFGTIELVANADDPQGTVVRIISPNGVVYEYPMGWALSQETRRQFNQVWARQAGSKRGQPAGNLESVPDGNGGAA